MFVMRVTDGNIEMRSQCRYEVMKWPEQSNSRFPPKIVPER